MRHPTDLPPTPAAAPKLLRIDVAGHEIAVWEWNAEAKGSTPSIVLAHATGFHGRCWDPVVRRLNGLHVLAVDQRGHGRSSKTRFASWADFGLDLAQVLRAFDVLDGIGVGHSMGGHATVEAARHEPTRLRHLLLIDPVILPPERYGSARLGTIDFDGSQHPTARRRNHFDSPEAMIARFIDRPPYSRFHPEALDAYCRFGLEPVDDGGTYVLACPPWFEASIYGSARSNPDVLAHAAALAQPITVVRAQEARSPEQRMDFSYSPTWPGLAASLRHGTDVHLPEQTHFLPMEDPERTAALLLAVVRQATEAIRASDRGETAAPPP